MQDCQQQDIFNLEIVMMSQCVILFPCEISEPPPHPTQKFALILSLKSWRFRLLSERKFWFEHKKSLQFPVSAIYMGKIWQCNFETRRLVPKSADLPVYPGIWDVCIVTLYRYKPASISSLPTENISQFGVTEDSVICC